MFGEILFANSRIAIDTTGEYYLAPDTVVQPRSARPANQDRLHKAQRAAALGLPVEMPAAEYHPAPGIPVGGTCTEITTILRRAWKTLKFRTDLTYGKKVVDRVYHHVPGCACGECPCDLVYGQEHEIGPGFEASGIPEEWFCDHDRTRVRVQSSDFRWIYEDAVAGYICMGSICHPRLAQRLGAPAAVVEHLQKLMDESDARWDEHQKRKEAEERAQLAAEFGVQ